jgi:hypothetical protein
MLGMASAMGAVYRDCPTCLQAGLAASPCGLSRQKAGWTWEKYAFGAGDTSIVMRLGDETNGKEWDAHIYRCICTPDADNEFVHIWSTAQCHCCYLPT